MNRPPIKLEKNIKDFFYRMENYIETDIIFYGSATRDDYVPGKSDIDAAIFTDNEYSIMSKLQHFLHVKKSAFDKIVWKLNGKMIYGYKIKIDNINAEIAIYNTEFKKILLEEYSRPFKNKTILTTIAIYILKLFYYQYPIISTKFYQNCKRFILNDMMGQKNSLFFLLKQDHKKV